MRILIFGEAFLPPAYMPRVRYFCSYFIEKGWQIDYVVESKDSEMYIPKGVSVFPLDYYKNVRGFKAKFEWLLKFFLGLAMDYKGRYFYRKSKPFWKDKSYDLVFCSSNLTFPLTTAEKVAKEKGIPLFVDLRDIAEQSPDDDYYIARKPPRLFGKPVFEIYKRVNLNRRNRVLREADAVTTVSPWHVETLSKYNPNTYLIYNGFDEHLFYPEDVKTEKFTISYFGRVYNELMRNPRPLFEAIKQLQDEGVLSSQNTVVKWFVDDNSRSVIQSVAGEYGLGDFMYYNPFIKPVELLPQMSRSSVLLVLSNVQTKKRFFGIMTTKFFEAVGANRPVLCIPDNHDNLTCLIERTNSGLVTSLSSEVAGFLREKFSEWKQTGLTQGTVDENIRMDYSRRKGAEILESLFLQTKK